MFKVSDSLLVELLRRSFCESESVWIGIGLILKAVVLSLPSENPMRKTSHRSRGEGHSVNVFVLQESNWNTSCSDMPDVKWYQTDNVRINAILRRVRVTVVAVEEEKVLHILSVSL